MGRFDITQLLFPDEAGDGEARPIGGIPSVKIVELTAIQRNKNAEGEYVFGGQIPVELGELVMRSIDDSNPDMGIHRMEFKYGLSDGRIYADAPLICSEYPYSSFWAAGARFKRGYQDINELHLHFDSREEMLAELATAKVDWWESNSKKLTASLDEDKFRIFFQARKRTAWQGRYWVFGVIPDATGGKAADLSLIESEIFVSPAIQKLIRKTVDGSLTVGRKGSKPRVFTRDEANALAWFSVRQALAGPHQECEQWEGTPVASLADRIYRDHLFNLSRRTIEKQSDRYVDIDNLDSEDEDLSLTNSDILSVGGARFLALEQEIEARIANGLPDWRNQVDD